MTPNTTTMTEHEQTHPAAHLETIVVDPDDVITMMERNERDKDQQRSHVLRVTPPLIGRREASLHVSDDHTFYPSDMDPKPLHLGATAFLAGHIHPQHPEFPDECRYPNRHDSRGRFYEYHDLLNENGGRPSELTNEQEELWEEWWDTELNHWEQAVRANLKETITLEQQTLDGTVRTTVDVQYE